MKFSPLAALSFVVAFASPILGTICAWDHNSKVAPGLQQFGSDEEMEAANGRGGNLYVLTVIPQDACLTLTSQKVHDGSC
jgi:hypothetical protein